MLIEQQNELQWKTTKRQLNLKHQNKIPDTQTNINVIKPNIP